jgi:hypothetical protein
MPAQGRTKGRTKERHNFQLHFHIDHCTTTGSSIAVSIIGIIDYQVIAAEHIGVH